MRQGLFVFWRNRSFGETFSPNQLGYQPGSSVIGCKSLISVAAKLLCSSDVEMRVVLSALLWTSRELCMGEGLELLRQIAPTWTDAELVILVTLI